MSASGAAIEEAWHRIENRRLLHRAPESRTLDRTCLPTAFVRHFDTAHECGMIVAVRGAPVNLVLLPAQLSLDKQLPICHTCRGRFVHGDRSRQQRLSYRPPQLRAEPDLVGNQVPESAGGGSIASVGARTGTARAAITAARFAQGRRGFGHTSILRRLSRCFEHCECGR